MFDGGTACGQDAVCFFLAVGELAGAGGFVAGDDHGLVGVGVQAEEAQVGQGAEAGGPRVIEDVVVAGGGDVVGAAGAGRGITSYRVGRLRYDGLRRLLPLKLEQLRRAVDAERQRTAA